LGNYVGALANWVKLQETHECFYMAADWHAVSTNYAETAQIRPYTREMLIDWLAAGLDPRRSTIFVQSSVPEHAVLHLLLSMIVPVPWLERNPTYKEQQEQLANRDLATYGFMGYPVLQSADILLYLADEVPVGHDQLPHLELTREIARRFNHLFAEVFPEPKPLLTEAPKLPGTDGRKMSKSYNNAIYLSDSEPTVREKLRDDGDGPGEKTAERPGNLISAPCSRSTTSFPLRRRSSASTLTAARPPSGVSTAGPGGGRNRGASLADVGAARGAGGRPCRARPCRGRGTERARSVAGKTLAAVNAAMHCMSGHRAGLTSSPSESSGVGACSGMVRCSRARNPRSVLGRT
jgi:tryptophanyl-tRNA synthetase